MNALNQKGVCNTRVYLKLQSQHVDIQLRFNSWLLCYLGSSMERKQENPHKDGSFLRGPVKSTGLK